MITFINKAGKQIALAVGVVLLHKLAELGTHIGTAHIRRVGDHHIVLPGQHLRHADQGQDGGQGSLLVEADVVFHFFDPGIQGGKVHGCNCEDGAVLLSVPQIVQDAVHGGFQLRIAAGKIIQRVCVYAVALDDGVHMGLNATGEDAPVVLPGLHHHGKIGKLRRPVVDVQTVEVVLQDALAASRSLTPYFL